MKAMARILVVEDEVELNEMVCDFLASQGHEASGATDGAEALKRFFEVPPELVVLDLNLPTVDGLSVARTIRTQSEVPVIVISARGEEEDRIDGFRSGVDDYVVKPLSLPELALRIEAILRRRNGAHSGTRLVVGDLVVDAEERQVSIAGRAVPLTLAQFEILRTLAGAPRRVFTRLQLLQSYQPNAFAGYERTIDVHVKNLRKLIETDPSQPRRIVTVRGVGYRMEIGS